MSDGLKITRKSNPEKSEAERAQEAIDSVKEESTIDKKEDFGDVIYVEKTPTEDKPKEEESKEPITDTEKPVEETDPVEDKEPVTDTDPAEDKEPVQEKVDTPNLTDESVLSYLGEKLGREINSLDDLTRQESNDLPEHLQKIDQYMKDTGRGVDDWVRLQQDFSTVSDDEILRMYESEQNPHLSPDDVSFKLEDMFGVDEDSDTERDIKKKEIAKKDRVAAARKHYENQKEQYKAPLESSGGTIDPEVLERANKYKQLEEQQKSDYESAQKRSQHFMAKTEELFSDKFEGFEYDLGESHGKVTYKVEDKDSVKSMQSDLNNFIKKHVDKDGMLIDGAKYHKGLFAASDPDKFAKFFMELGYAKGIEDKVKESKNTKMDAKSAGKVADAPKSGRNVEIVRSPGESSGSGLRVNPGLRKK